jgi:hypothetical protein
MGRGALSKGVILKIRARQRLFHSQKTDILSCPVAINSLLHQPLYIYFTILIHTASSAKKPWLSLRVEAVTLANNPKGERIALGHI